MELACNARDCVIVTLNWNGIDHTKRLVHSYLETAQSCSELLIIDNGSTPDEVEKLRRELKGYDFELSHLSLNLEGSVFKVDCYQGRDGGRILVLWSDENLGFSKGCNLGASVGKRLGFKSLFFCNNDVVIPENALQCLIKAHGTRQEAFVFPRINYLSKPDTTWNCGGHISRFGRIHYNDANLLAASSALVAPIQVQFVTGCCVLVSTELFFKVGSFTEKFFFGEEDVELCLRLDRISVPIICMPDVVFYHNVGSSLKRTKQAIAHKAFIHYLNRLTNLRSFRSPVEFQLMKALYFVKGLQRFGGHSAGRITAAKTLYRLSGSLQGVDKKRFQNMLKGQI